MSDLVTSHEYDQLDRDALALERAHLAPLRGAGDTETYRDYQIERRYTDGQPDSLVFSHEEYDGPGDNRIGHGRDLRDVCAQIDEQIRDRKEMECAG